MNNVIERKWCTKGTVYIEDLTGTAFTGEDGGHTFVISGVNPDGTAVTLAGTVAGAYILPDGSTQPLTGSIADGKAQITLDPECYALPGRGQLTIFLMASGQKVAIYGAVLNVARSSTDQVPPAITADVADLVNDIEEARATIPASYTNLMASLAKNYADLTYPVAAGTYAWQDGWMYRAKVDIPSAESWKASHWGKVPLADSLVDELSALKSALIQYTIKEDIVSGVYENGTINSAGQIVTDNNYNLYIAKVSAGDNITINVSEYSNQIICAFYDSYPVYGLIGINGRTIIQAESATVTVPNGAEYIAMRDSKQQAPFVVVVGSLQDRVTNLEDKQDTFATSEELNLAINGPKTIKTEALKDIAHAEWTNYINPENVVLGFFKGSTGEILVSGDFHCTGKVYLAPDTEYYYSDLYSGGYYGFYAEDGTKIAGYDTGTSLPNPFTTPPNTAYGYFSATTEARISGAWISTANEKPEKYGLFGDFYAKYHDDITEMNPCDFEGNDIQVFRKCLCIGDSFTQGGFNYDHDSGDGSLFQDYSYPTKLAMMTGMEVTNKGVGGITTPGWWNTFGDPSSQPYDTSGHDMAIILLGINDCANYGEFGESSKTAMLNIINKLKTENAGIKIFVCTIPLSANFTTPAILASREIVLNLIDGIENVYPVDLMTYSHLPDAQAYQYGHPSAFGYWRLAKDIKNYVSYIMSTNKSDFRFVQFIGTPYTHNTPY